MYARLERGPAVKTGSFHANVTAGGGHVTSSRQPNFRVKKKKANLKLTIVCTNGTPRAHSSSLERTASLPSVSIGIGSCIGDSACLLCMFVDAFVCFLCCRHVCVLCVCV